jgi:hypothetical protein
MGEPGTVYMRAQRIVVGGLGQTLHRAQLLALAELESAVSLGAGVTPWLALPWQLVPSNDALDFAAKNLNVLNTQMTAVIRALGVADTLPLVGEGLDALQLTPMLGTRLKFECKRYSGSTATLARGRVSTHPVTNRSRVHVVLPCTCLCTCCTMALH